ncbi:hypothetical protein CTA2_4823 [Colletotrichum tanaceti]|nr:hypothetical protein CTA2_4823 [Colletotrichum tanaceti]
MSKAVHGHSTTSRTHGVGPSLPMPLRRLLGRVARPMPGIATPRVCVSLRLRKHEPRQVDGTPQEPRPSTGPMSMRQDPARRPRRRTFQELPSRKQAVRLLATGNSSRRRGPVPPPRVRQPGGLSSSLQYRMQGTEARTTEEGEMKTRKRSRTTRTPPANL